MIVEGSKVTKIERKVEEVVFPPTVKYIGQFACIRGSLKWLDLKESNIFVIDRYAFYNCIALTNIRFPSNLEEIYEGAFRNCENLKEVCFPSDSNLKIIGPEAFCRCCILNKIQFPRYLEKIYNEAFFECRQLKNVDLRNTKLKYLGINVFGSDVLNSYIFLPSTIEARSIINNHFSCLEIEKDHPTIKKDNTGYYIINSTIFRYWQKKTHVRIRRSVEKIAKYCFHKSNLVSISIPASVIEICESAFEQCEKLQTIRFLKDSQLKEIKNRAFNHCVLLKKVKFPKSLKILRKSFCSCIELEEISFPHDSKLEIIEAAFQNTDIKNLYLPSSVREIKYVHKRMNKLEYIHVNNDLYVSSLNCNSIFSKDGSELICVIYKCRNFEIPDGVRVIRKRALFTANISDKLIIPSSVEVIEEKAFDLDIYYKCIEFAAGSKLKSLGFNALPRMRELVINNKNFVTLENGVVMSLRPRGIVFAPRELTNIEFDPRLEVIYANAFYESNIEAVNFPNNLKKICYNAFNHSNLHSVIFEIGTELDLIDKGALDFTHFSEIKFPLVKDRMHYKIRSESSRVEFPPNFSPKHVDLDIYYEHIRNQNNSHSVRIVCPISSLPAIICHNIDYKLLEIIDG